jgi:hypothetical protein
MSSEFVMCLLSLKGVWRKMRKLVEENDKELKDKFVFDCSGLKLDLSIVFQRASIMISR